MRKVKNKEDKKLTVFTQRNTAIAEQFRIIRTSLQFLAEKRSAKRFMVTSSASGEGKSVVIANLAAFFAQQEKRVLIIDGDLRRPTQNEIFQVENYYGFTDILKDGVDVKKVIQKTEVENLDVLVSGIVPHNPAELLASFDFEAFFAELDADYDFIFVDAPPAILADTPIIASKVDGVIVVVALYSVKRSKLEQTIRSVRSAGANVVGIICNKAKRTKRTTYYYKQ
ncbi:CpsD/CapB family tyrosine-protein kinase [Listeria booriae]|uniref:non-specific protein-tyrosine kinase n=1 Tax=Listeria booriae TaxID=1552123 RepID=A0A841XVH6_9LIST|nr:CpsD/CapB family tyrosine-protein kinase [Listeria booriae]MBC1212414.1 CpsD/CapB family tyrosine-protein kinase [Listeria booriae]MBC1317049.1 CpsD/CapB family tyrosine-protein kinase [Listeria booriae]MBC1554150.1 CpsD/CapB family tyrosine-protein kinase [Listeria booriae]MBC2106489.1 CpsD/CapB family tyrosine-protein kinase [Listeria booriae]MBC2171281.1 CpsD/CapB family tyrosine-protein kinase [Listeria booriae]